MTFGVTTGGDLYYLATSCTLSETASSVTPNWIYGSAAPAATPEANAFCLIFRRTWDDICYQCFTASTAQDASEGLVIYLDPEIWPC